MFKDKDFILEESYKGMSEVVDEFSTAGILHFREVEPSETALCIVDVINGFMKFGALANPDAMKIVANISRLAKMMTETGSIVCAVNDSHEKDSPEFDSFPVHCLKNSEESKLVGELEWLYGYEKFHPFNKQSTNAFHEYFRQDAMQASKNISNIIVTGVCTDICVMQFALSLKTYFNSINRKCRVIVPLNCVDTYDAPSHNRVLMNAMAVKMMRVAGVEIAAEIVY